MGQDSSKHKRNKSDPRRRSDPPVDTHAGSRSSRDYKSFTKNFDTSALKHDPSEPITKYYDITDKILGVGNFSVVKLGTNRETGQSCAIKVVDKTGVKNKPDMLTNEVGILLKVDHPNIIKLLDLFDTPNVLYLVMELVTGGELFDKIVEREQYSENDAQIVMKQLFRAIEYLHNEAGIVHRDLKPENLLLATDDDDAPIKIADFGLSKIYSEEMMSTACGTPGYVAPEILKCEGYDKEVDLWSAGVIMYIILCGYPPFYDENDAVLFENIMDGRFEFHSPYWDNICEEAKDLIKKLLVVDPRKRLTATEALKHHWFDMTFDRSMKLHHELAGKMEKHNSVRRSKISIAVPNANRPPKIEEERYQSRENIM
jgi:calcium/calmodulin-dependent protein kinase I